MKIKKVEIDSFGKLKNMPLTFIGGIQILYGENERGKSTLMEFIKIMLYGDIGRNMNASFRANKYPWEGGRFGGTLEFENNDKLYKVQKQLDTKSPSKDKVLFTCLSNGKSISLGKREEIGERVLGLSLGDFERSGYINCMGESPFNTGKSAKDMLLNLISTGDENVSKEESDKYLDSAMKNLKWKNNSGGEIIDLGKEIVKLQDELYKREKIKIQEEKIKKYISEIDSKIKKRNNLKKLLEYINLSDRLVRLKQLLALIQQRNSLRKRLQNSKFNYNEAKQRLCECETIYQKVEDIEKNMTQIEEQIRKHTSLDISKDELEEVKKYESEIKKFTNTMSDIDNTYLPESKSLIDGHKSYRDKLNKLKLLKENIKAQECEVSKYIEMVQTYNKLIAESNFIAEQEKKETGKLQEYVVKVSSESEKYKKIIKVSNIIIACLFIALMACLFFQQGHLSFYVLSVIAIVGILDLHLIKTIKLFQKQKDILASKLKEVLAEKQENTTKTEKLQNDISHLETIHKKYSQDIELINKYEIETSTQKANLENNQHKLEIVLNKLVKKLDIKYENILLSDEDIYVRFLNLSSEVEIGKIYISNKLKQKLESKGCHSSEEFFEKYNCILKSEGLKALLISKEKELKEKKEFFVSIMKLYVGTDSFKECVDEFNILHNCIKEEKMKDINIRAFVKTLNLESEDTNYIKNAILETEKSVNSIRGKCQNLNVNGVDAINHEIESLEAQNLEMRREELQGEICVFPDTIEEIKEKLQAKQITLKKKKSYLASLELAKTLIDESYNELRGGFGNRINERASEVFKNLTSNKYETLTVQNDYSILIKTEVFDRKYDLFSSGTIDQSYLALRLSLSEIISKNVTIPLILDDVLVRYDEERLYNTLKYLKRYSLENSAQIIIFTCHKYILGIGKKLEIPPIELI